MVRPAIRCSRCIPNTDTKQRAAATIGAMLRRQVASKELSSSNLAAAKRLRLFAAALTASERFLTVPFPPDWSYGQ